MKKTTPIPTRLKAGSPGLGYPSQPEIESRAMELAQSDGRDRVTDDDLAKAAAELSGGHSAPVPPEADSSTVEDLTTWDEPVEQPGHRVPRLPLEDAENIAAELVEEGVSEADHDSRVSAEDEDEREEEENA